MLKVGQTSQSFDKGFLRYVLRVRHSTQPAENRRRKPDGHILKAQNQRV